MVHAHIAELAGEGKGDSAGAAVRWLDVQDDAEVGKFGGQILVLAGQGMAPASGSAGEGEGGAALG